jgi:hypothetical protein
MMHEDAGKNTPLYHGYHSRKDKQGVVNEEECQKRLLADPPSKFFSDALFNGATPDTQVQSVGR